MESPSTFQQPPVDTFTPETSAEEVKFVEYPAEECEGAVLQSGCIKSGRVFNAGSN